MLYNLLQKSTFGFADFLYHMSAFSSAYWSHFSGHCIYFLDIVHKRTAKIEVVLFFTRRESHFSSVRQRVELCENGDEAVVRGSSLLVFNVLKVRLLHLAGICLLSFIKLWELSLCLFNPYSSNVPRG